MSEYFDSSHPMVKQCLALALLTALVLAPMGSEGRADDTDLFRSSVPPNILFVVDNSKSMNNSVTHPDYETDPGTGINKNQTSCTAFRDQTGSKMAFWNAGKYVQIKSTDNQKVKGSLDNLDGLGNIVDAFGTKAVKDPNAATDPGAELYYEVDTTDQGKGLAYWYHTGLPIIDSGTGLQYFQGSGTTAKMETRITPREAAANNGVNPMTLEISSSATICGVPIPSGWSLWAGDPDIEVPSGSTMQVKFQYLDFLFSTVGASARETVFAPTFANDGMRNYSSCLAYTGAANEYEVYRRSRLIALHKILQTVVCEVNEKGIARFGVAQFRYRGTGGNGNVQGGYAVLPINDFKVWDEGTNQYVSNRYDLHGFVNTTHADHLERVIQKIGPDSTTPLAETLFQSYTYFMSREYDKLPEGRDWEGDSTGVKFPVYSYDTSQPDASDPKDLDIVGGHFLALSGQDANAAAPECPVESYCQKNFILFITDGGSFHDTFSYDLTNFPLTDPVDTGQGFADFDSLIGDHYRNSDGTADETEWSVNNKKVQLMDDISYFMNRWDFMPDETNFPGSQTIDTYTVGYALETGGDSNLERTAHNGNGLYFESADSDQLAADLVEAIADMIDKAQSFTSATVPASRTADGNNFYSSYFRPTKDSPFWEGHLRAFDFTLRGDILTSEGKCAVGTDVEAVSPCANNGKLRITALPFWDAAEHVPVPMSRNLYVAKGSSSFATRSPLWSTITRTELELLPSDLLHPLYSAAITPTLQLEIDALGVGDDIDVELATESEASLDALTTMISKNIAGCEFGTSCTTRTDDAGTPTLLADIYHSNPVVVGSPNSSINEPSYRDFRNTYRSRTRVIYAGSNGGFLHGFDAGTWVSTDPDTSETLAIPYHDRGTGVELFGFMPSKVRSTAHELPTHTSFPRNWYGVDGSPVVGDVWLYRDMDTDGAVDATLPTADDPKTESQWRTILLGGLRQGGNGYYALDITNPGDSTNYPGYLWEFPCDALYCGSSINADTASESDYMGETWSESIITRVRVLGDVDTYTGNGQERWVAIFGAGYSEEGDPNSAQYEDDTDDNDAKKGRAIYMVDITTGRVLAKKYWSKVAVFSGSTQVGFPEMRYAIASQPVVYDLDFDGFADVIYIGDVGGNLWKWVVSDFGDDPINNGTYNDDVAQPAWSFRLFFRSPAVTEPAVGAVPDFTLTDNLFRSIYFPPTGVLRSGNLKLAFGTGDRANVSRWDEDGLTTNNNRFYVVTDEDPLDEGASIPNALTGYLAESDLATNAQLNAAWDETSGTCGPLASYDGFMIDARDAEMFVTNSAIFLGDVITGSFVPPDPNGTNLCEASGKAWTYRFSVDCGMPPNEDDSTNQDAERRKSIGDGMPTRPRVSAGSLADASNSSDPCANRVVIVTSDGSVDNECHGTSAKSGSGVRSWLQR